MERNVMGELNMHRAAGTKPNFSDIARRHGLDRHTVARYWAAGEEVEDRRSESESPPFPLTHRVPFGHDAVNGERGHGMGHPSPEYSAEFKQQAVRLYNERGTTYAEVARELGVDPGSLSDWVKRADAAQAPAGDNPFQMAEDLRRLRRENERLKRENEILLKASAFFASRRL
ncbi:MAG: transposase [Bifidobacterium sp.]|nr:transposase [Bifidobacterium sp.]